MIAKTKMSNRVMSLIVTISLLLSMIPFTALTANAIGTGMAARVSDPSTIDQWKQYFPTSGDITTENAGGIWTDKSVFTSNTTIDGQNFSIEGQNNFLVALSALGSNMTVTGMTQVPTDVMFVLDVSGSMNEDNNDAAEQLVAAANASIKSLLDANPYNRVGVVLYSGPSTTGNGSLANATVVLPLASYRTDNAQGKYLNYTNQRGTETVSVLNSEVYTEAEDGSKQYASRASKTVVGGTYVQAGLALAEDEFLAATTTATPNGMGTVTRKPAIVLMSDGAVSLATDSFHNPGTSNMGDGTEAETTYEMAFVTELTAAHTKYRVSEKYGVDCLFYTLGMIDENHTVTNGYGRPDSAQTTVVKNVVYSVLDPDPAQSYFDNSESRWTEYKNTQAGRYYSLGSGRSVLRVADDELAQMPMDYVDRFFDANDYVQGGSLGDALAEAFEAIVADIALQTEYHPTLVENNDSNFSGYVSFVDKIGSYMKVSGIKGVVNNGTLFSGKNIAKKISEELVEAGTFGSEPVEGETGYVFVDSVATRLGISHTAAWSLLKSAWDHGQLKYNSASDYSDWFGWVSTSAGAYICPWYEGMTLPINAGYINRSYIYLGTNENTDAMYSTVRVREKVDAGVLTGEQEVDFAIPAALLPTVTYRVDLDENGKATNIMVDGDTPISLVYEVGLDPEINEFNVKDKVSAEYLAANTADSGEILFYTNAWERDGSTGYGKVNTYAYYRPSRQNDRHYYQSDSLVYSDTEGTVYKGTAEPSGDMYYYYHYYTVQNGNADTKYEYHKIPSQVLEVAEKNVDNSWTIKAGTVRSDYANANAAEISKDENKTGTLTFSHEPFADSNSAAWDDPSHSHVVGITMANNGRLALEPETGIRLTKNMAADVDVPEEEFVFEISYSDIDANLQAYAYRFDNAGNLIGAETAVAFTNGKATVTLKAGETLYIGGMTSGTVTVTEQTVMEYVVETVSVNGTPQTGKIASASLKTGDMVNIDFINTKRGTGILNVAKAVMFPEGVSEEEIAKKTFTATVHLEWNGEPLADYTVNNSTGQPFGTTNADGDMNITLSHGKQITLYGIPEGTIATVTENTASLPNGFSRTPMYWEQGERNKDGVIEITSTAVADVMIENIYTPSGVSADFEIYIEKYFFVGDDRQASTLPPIGNGEIYEFEFYLQRLTDAGWVNVGEAVTITYTNASTSVAGVSGDLEDRLQNEEYTEAGIYRYRVIETLGDESHVIYDQRTHSFGVEVADDDADGAWEIKQARTSSDTNAVQITQQGNVYRVDVSFDNRYDGDIEAEAVIEIKKTVKDPAGVVYKDGTIELAEGFEFKVFEYDPATKTIGTQVGKAQTTNTGGVTRFTLTYGTAEVGTHYYVIEETNVGGAGWTYAADQYVTVVVSADGGVMSAAAYIDNENGTASVPASPKNSITVAFENTYAPKEASLDVGTFVSKQLNGREFTANDSFTFEIKGTNGSSIYDANGETVASIAGHTTATSGGTSSVVFDQNLYFNKVGTYYYQITETSTDGNGITTDKTVHHVTVNVTDDSTGALKATYTVTSGAGNTIAFVNTYKAQPISMAITGSKTITGRTLTEDDFFFVLTEAGTNNTWYATNESFGGNESEFAFPAITYTEAGTHTYTVREFNPKSVNAEYYDGVTYDTTEYTVVMTVADNGDGTLSANYVVNNNPTTEIEFANNYNPTSVSVQLRGIKAILGRGLTEDDEFDFELYEADYDETTRVWTKKAGSPKQTKSNTGGAILFDNLTFTKAGVYRYMVSEIQENEKGITCDTTTWRIAIVVSDDGEGTLSAQTYYINDDGLQNAMIFLNSYDVSDGFIEIEGTKTLENKDLAAGRFEFELYETDDTFEIAEGANVYKSKNDATGNFKFKLDYTKDDIGKTFYYVAVEKNAGRQIGGITYSQNKYLITVTVEDKLDGTLDIQKTVMLADAQKDILAFTNTYTAAGTSVVIDGTKKLDGRPLKNGEFSFELYASDANWQKGDVLRSTNNAADGAFAFEKLDYSAVGSYYYIVAEKSGANDVGIKYDDTEYRVLVEVTDNGSGNLVANVTYLDENGEVDALVFNNIYTIASGNLVIEGNKILTGRDLRNEEFTFEMYEADADFNISGSALKSAKNGADGKFSFAVEYTKDDAGETFYYVVKEADTGANGVTYSTDKYCITVTVADSEKGKLTITPGMTLNGGNIDAIEFVNKYADTVKATVEITKVVENKGSESISPEGFEFLLELVGGENPVKVTTDANGKAVITLDYTEADIGETFTYKLSEIKGDKLHVTYDDKVYTFTVTVGLDAEDNLVATVKFGEEAVDVLKAQFVNTYDYTPNIPSSPQTGDNFNLGLWIALLFVSGGGIAITTVGGKKRDQSKHSA